MIKILTILLLMTFLLSCAYMKRPMVSRQLTIEKKWVRQTQESRNVFNYHLMEPIVTPQVIYQGNATDGISAYKRKSGERLWKLNIENGFGGRSTVGGRHPLLWSQRWIFLRH